MSQYTKRMDLIFGIELLGFRGPQAPKLGENDIYEVLETLMGLVPEEDIAVIQMISPHPRRVDICTKCQEVWRDRDLFKFMDQYYVLSNGKKVFITRPYEETNTVKVKRVPIWWRNSDIERVFSNYGDVKSVKEDIFRSSRNYYKGIYNGNYTVKMKVKKSIPSSITVQGDRFEIYYYKQTPTCWRCGREHYKDQCDAKVDEDYVNRFSMDDFPQLPEPQQIATSGSATSSTNNSMTDLSVSAPVVSTDSTVSKASSEPNLSVSVTNASGSVPVVATDPIVSKASSEPSTAVSSAPSTTEAIPAVSITQVPASDSSVVEQESVSVPSVMPAIASMTLASTESSEITSVPVSHQATKATVKTVTSITVPVISATTQEGLGEETTDGEGTIDKAFEEFVATPTIEVHHAQDSQVMGDANASSVMDLDWEASLAAEEWDDDNLITPAQRISTELRSQPDQTEDMCTIEIQDDTGSDIQAGKRKANGSSDEENSIVYQFGSFVNSLFSESSEAKEKKETKKVKIEEVQNI